MAPFHHNSVNRRSFIETFTATVGIGALLTPTARIKAMPFSQDTQWTVGQVMDLFIREVPGAPFPQTVDTLKSGSRDLRVTGIITTMFATVEVIRKAIALKANFIIAHEPTFYNHLDETSWLSEDPVYRYKADLLKKHNIAVWRNHDYIHRLTTDGVRAGVVKQLQWEKYTTEGKPAVFQLPSITLQALIQHVKNRIGVPTVRFIGDPAESCEKILLMPGASGGRSQISAIAREIPDVVLCGEISEWETAEYVRDARAKGQKLALIVMGHVASEEGGSAFLANWLNERIKGINTTHVPAGNSLMFG